MNLLIFENDELVAGSRLSLSGRRAEHIINILGSGVGDILRVGMLEGKIGLATVTDLHGGCVELEVELTDTPSRSPRVDLILALPRPIMLQRILKQATVLGVRNFHLIRSNRVEKSFFHSPVLQPEKIKSLLVEGLEQAMDTMIPKVRIHERFKPFVEDVIPELAAGHRIVAHPGFGDNLVDVLEKERESESILLAIGPEGGWTDHEIDSFLRQGFFGFTMGQRILHVDTAVVALLAQLEIAQVFLNR